MGGLDRPSARHCRRTGKLNWRISTRSGEIKRMFNSQGGGGKTNVYSIVQQGLLKQEPWMSVI